MKQILEHWDADSEGDILHGAARDLFPICRSITGNGMRESLERLRDFVPLELHEVPTGTQVFDWEVPREWNIRDAWIKNEAGERVVDFNESNLHVLNYSVPVHTRMSLAELRPHLHTLPDTPDWIPYRTSYYRDAWGFCLSERKLSSLPEGEYEVCVDATLEAGHLTYGEFRVAGGGEGEILLSCHSCHPSLANDNLSGMVVAARLAQLISDARLRHSVRFLWIPGTIGAITWLSRNEDILPRIRHGLVLSCVGDPGGFTYKRTPRGDADVDRAVSHVLAHCGTPFRFVDFTPYGYDERQYCSPGIDLPVGCFMRTPNGQYPQYHTSADDLDFITPSALSGSLHQLLHILDVLEHNRCYENLSPKCEPQLGRRGLYRQTGGTKSSGSEEAILWVLHQSDGTRSLLDVAERSGIAFATLHEAAQALVAADLLRLVD